ncbi:hypothetical protein HDC91_003775 [Mucilaginibacter sp. AK015]|nr:hypothetical protein [Mucilaginibacter sp. AK015]
MKVKKSLALPSLRESATLTVFKVLYFGEDLGEAL